MIKHLRVLLVLVASCVAFVGLANTAVVWNGALFVVGVGPLIWLSDKGFGWALNR